MTEPSEMQRELDRLQAMDRLSSRQLERMQWLLRAGAMAKKLNAEARSDK